MQSKESLLTSTPSLKKTLSEDFISLAKAIMSGNSARFAKYLKKVIRNREINCVTNILGSNPGDAFEEVSLSYLAAHYKRKEFMKELLNSGADVDYFYPKNKCYLLHIVAQEGWIDVLKQMIERKVSINVLANNGTSPLFMAAKNCRIEVLKTLVSNGADLVLTGSGESEQQFTPLTIAVMQGHFLVVVTVLHLMKQVGIYKFEIQLKHALSASIEMGKPEIRTLLDKTIKTEFNDESAGIVLNNAILQSAADHGFIDTAENALLQGADVNTMTAELKFPPLYLAAQGGHCEMVRLLLHRGANPLLADKYGELPVLAALSKGHVEVLKLLYSDKRMDIKKPLTISFSNPRFQDIQETVAGTKMAYYQPSSTDYIELTPLHIALYLARSTFTVISALLDLGADPNSICYGQSVLKIALIANVNINVLNLLLSKGATVFEEEDADISSILYIAIATLNNDAVQVLVKKLSAAETHVDNLNCLLTCSYIFNNPVAASCLISKGADPNTVCPDNNHKTIHDWLTITSRTEINQSKLMPVDVSAIQISSRGKENPEPSSENIDKEKPVEKAPTVLSASSYADTSISMSGRKYLRTVLKLSDPEVDLMISLNKKSKKTAQKPASLFFPVSPPSPEKKFTCCNGKITSNQLQPIEGNVALNCFYLFPPEEFLQKQGCSQDLIMKFKAKRALFDPFHIKKLDDDIAEYIVDIQINGVSYSLKATHELKINGPQRLLVLELPSDDNNAKMYIPAIFVDLHRNKDIKSQESSTKTFILNISGSEVKRAEQPVLMLGMR